MSDGIICAEKLTRRFKTTIALRDLDLCIERGEIFGLVGPDGAGKTTTLRLLAAVMTPTSGTVTVVGHDSVKHAEQIRSYVGYMPQRFSLYGDLSVRENLEFYADIFGVHGADRRQRFAQVLNFSRMAPFVDRRAGALSGGMQKKLGLACTLIHRPDVLLLDEPTTGVDPVSRREFWKLLSEFLSQGITIVMSTPYLDEAERCSRVALLHNGQLLALDTPDALRRSLPGALFEVIAADHRQAVAALRRFPDVANVQTFGERAHVRLTEAGGQGADRLTRELREAGVAVTSVRQVPPSLEDVFVTRLGELQ